VVTYTGAFEQAQTSSRRRRARRQNGRWRQSMASEEIGLNHALEAAGIAR
jgi:L-lactate utilization protein LutB